MRKLPYFLLAALTVPAAGALAVSGSDSPFSGGLGNLSMQPPTQASAPAPDRIVKFYGMSFSDTASWSCSPSVPDAAQGSPAVQASNCMSCTNQGSGSGDIVIDRPPDGAQETIPAPSGAEVQICGDVLALRGAASSAGFTATTGSSSASPSSLGSGSGSSAFSPVTTSTSTTGTGTSGSASGGSGNGTSGTKGTGSATGTASTSGSQGGSAFGPAQ